MNAAIAIAGSVPQVITDPGAIAARDSLLAESAAVTQVKTAIDYESAGAVVADLKRIVREVEKARKVFKGLVK